MTVTAGVAAIKGTYAGSCTLSDLEPHQSLVMQLQGAGAPGTIDADVNVGFARRGDGATRISYEADAVVGGMVGGVGQRMLTSVSKRMAGEFFGNVGASIARRRARGRSRRRPTAPAAGGSRRRAAAGCLHRAAEGRRRRLPGRLPQGHRGRRRAGARSASSSARSSAGGADDRSRRRVDSTARDQAAAVRAREISARELLDLHLARIAERNPQLNAIVSLDEERARAGAAAADEALAPGRRRGAAARAAVRVQGHPRGGGAGGRRTARRCSPTTSPTPTSCSSSGYAARASS